MNNSDLFPNLPTYRDAYVHWAAVKPYSKGKSKGEKPLGGNRRFDRSLIRQDGNDIVCSLYGTDVIRYKPDNTIVLQHAGWESISTTEIMALVLRYRFVEGGGRRFALRDSGYPVIRKHNKMYVVDGNGVNHRFDSKIIIRPDNSVEGGATEYVHRIKKPLMAQIRKHYAEFVEYMTFYAQSVGNDLDLGSRKVAHLPTNMSEMRWNKIDLARQRSSFFAVLDETVSGDPLLTNEAKLETFFELSATIAANAYDYVWVGYGQRRNFVTPKTMREHFYELCKYEFSEALFEEVEAEKGKVVLDGNHKYVEFGADATLPWTY